MSAWKQPDRLPDDGWIKVERSGNDRLLLRCEGWGVAMSISRYNASRLYAMLGLFLDIPLPKAISKAIIITPPGKDLDVAMGFPEPKTLGEKMAQALIVSKMPDRIGDFVRIEPPVSTPEIPDSSNPSESSNSSPRRKAQKAEQWSKNQASAESFITKPTERPVASSNLSRAQQSSRKSSATKKSKSASSTRAASSSTGSSTAPSPRPVTGTGPRGSEHASANRGNRDLRNGKGRKESGLHGQAQPGAVHQVPGHEPSRSARADRAKPKAAARQEVAAREVAPCFDGGSDRRIRQTLTRKRDAEKIGRKS